MQDKKLPKIYCFINGGCPGLYHVVALAEDGNALAGHGSSNESWAKHDIGIYSNWKHDTYEKHYPDGYELEWVDNADTHPGVLQAIENNHKLGVADAG